MVASLLLGLALATLPATAADWPDLATAPKGPAQGAQDAAVLIAIEDYPFVEDVLGAGGNLDAWMAWLKNGRGVPLGRMQVLRDRDANARRIREAVATASSEVGPGGTLWFVFIGHGAPSKDGRDGLLVGANADRTAEGIYYESVPRSELVAALGRSPAARSVAVIDACFSGQSPSGQALVAGLQPLIPTALEVEAPSKVTVLTAAGSGEFSGPLAGRAQPAFSYLALGALRGWGDVDGGNGDGVVSAAEVLAWTKGALRATVRGRTQTPSLIGGDAPLSAVIDRAAPDVLAIGKPTTSTVSVDAGGASLDTTSDFAALAAKAAAAKAAREKAERDAAEAAARAAAEAQARAEAEAAEQARLEAELQRRRRAELDRQAGEVKARAARDFAALAPLLTGEASAETKPVLEAYVQQYGDVSVRFDGVVEKVEIAEVAKVLAAMGPQVVKGKLGYAMVRIAPGTFTMGSPASEEGRSSDEAEHRVTLTKAYLMGTTEVTQGLWTKVMGGNPSEKAHDGVTLVGDTLPVQNVSWCDAVVFANKLSALEGLTPAYGNAANCAAVTWNRGANGYRLPTEAEWEYAARAGSRNVYAGTSEQDAVCRLANVADARTKSKWSSWTTFACDDGVAGLAPVGRYASNAWGLYDMTGNVWEWTWDWYGDTLGTATDPVGASSGAYRVNRGGSWGYGPLDARVAYRSSGVPGSRVNCLGLRLSRTVP